MQTLMILHYMKPGAAYDEGVKAASSGSAATGTKEKAG